MKKFTKRLFSFILVGMLLFSFLLTADAAGDEDIGAELGHAHVLNTGWEDAILLESGGHYALIDAGSPDAVRILSIICSAWRAAKPYIWIL